MLEAGIEARTCERALLELGVRSLKLNVQGNTGWPDRVFFIPGGRPLLIEFKVPGALRSERQKLIHAMLLYNGYEVETHDTEEEALRAIKAAVDSAVGAGWATQDPARYAAALGSTCVPEKGGEVLARTGRRRAVSRPRTGED